MKIADIALTAFIGSVLAGMVMNLVILYSPAEHVPDDNPASQQILVYGD